MSFHTLVRLTPEVCAQALFSLFASSLDTFLKQSEDSEVRHYGHSPIYLQNLRKKIERKNDMLAGNFLLIL